MTHVRLTAAVVTGVLLTSSGLASAQPVFQVVHAFGNGTTDGAYPYADLIQAADGNLYGTTFTGGTSGAGTVFQMTPAGAVTIMHAFTGGATDGAAPLAALIQATDGNFYGTTAAGGPSSAGTVFRMTTDGTVTVLHAFTGLTDGTSPQAALVQAADGNFYGTTVGTPGIGGTVFRITPDGSLTTLHAFTEGGSPPALIQATDGNFYGTTFTGGPSGAGTIFQMTPTGTVTVLHAFTGGTTDGSHPTALIQATDGDFYGTTSGSVAARGCPNGNGTVFKMTPDGTVIVLHNFTGGTSDRANPTAIIQASDGNFYGTARGGDSGCPYTNGTLFNMTSTGTITVLHTFAGGTTDGANPSAALLEATDGNFYGAAPYDGPSGAGVVFRLTIMATILAPAPRSTLTGSTVSFQWTSGTGVTDYGLSVGTTAGGRDLFDQEGTSLSQIVTGLPTDGSLVYVRLWSLIGDVWRFNDYTYIAATRARAQLITPAPGSTLTGSTVSFQWTSGTAVTQYWLYVGTTAGGSDLFDHDERTSLSQAVTGLPTNGSRVYVRLWSLIGTAVLFNDYTYLSVTPQAHVTTPALGSTLTTSSVSFQWTSGTAVTQYWLSVGTTVGGADVFDQSEGTSLGGTVTRLPTNGSTVYVRLWSLIGGRWLFDDYRYDTYAVTTPSAQMTMPMPGSTLTAASVPFQWTSGTGVTNYWLSVGTTLGGSNLFHHDEGTSLHQTVTGLPTNGSLVYVRLWSLVGAVWRFNDYPYSATTPQAQMTTPVPGSTLTASVASFYWTKGTAVTDYRLYVGTTVGGTELFNQDEGMSLSQMVTGLSTDGGAVYVRLWSLIGGGWQWNDYTYTAVTPQAQMSIPAPGSTLPASSVSFQWTRGTAVTGYWLFAGTIVGGKDLVNLDEGTNLSQIMTGLPTDGSRVYVRLWSQMGDVWQFNDYTYTAVTPQAQMTTPAPGTKLTGPTVWLQWTRGTGVTDYWLSVGTTASNFNLFNQNEVLNQGAMVTGLPTDGSAVYVRIWSLIGGAWQFNDHVYTAH